MAIICPCPHLSGKLSSTTRKVRTMTFTDEQIDKMANELQITVASLSKKDLDEFCGFDTDGMTRLDALYDVIPQMPDDVIVEYYMQYCIKYYVVEFLEKDGSIWSMAIKVKPGYTPTIENIETFLQYDMEFYEYDHVHDFYEVDEDEVYAGYDTDNIDSWPILGF